MEGNAPEKKFKAGPVSATIWKNQGTKANGEKTEYYTVTLERSYKDKDDKWQKTNSLRINDLPKADLILSKAYEYLTLKEFGSDAEEII